jgi:hypothetical protein
MAEAWRVPAILTLFVGSLARSWTSSNVQKGIGLDKAELIVAGLHQDASLVRLAMINAGSSLRGLRSTKSVQSNRGNGITRVLSGWREC